MGKSGSKLKKTGRSQSVIWGLKFPILRKRPKMANKTGPHMDVKQWLTALDLEQYIPLFEDFYGVEDLLDYTEADIKDLGVKNSAHRARIISSLVILRKKYPKGTARDKSQRHSVALDGGRISQRAETADLVLVSNVIQSKSLCNITMDTLDSSGLRKALEWELSLDSRDLRSHAWYHGAIPRTRAEEILAADGDFLVRDCASQPGNYVLSTRCKSQPLHFVINKVVLQPDTVYERVQFQFEDEAYDTVSDLITYYVGSGRAISALSGATIKTPKNRVHPLSFYATKYSLQPQTASRYNTIKREGPPKLPTKKREPPRKSSIESEAYHTPPPKPSRVPPLPTDLDRGYSGSDSGNGSGDSVDATTPTNIIRGVVIKNPRYRYAYDTIPNSVSSVTLIPDEGVIIRELPSTFDLDNFDTLLLPTLENKPVDASALQCVHSLIKDTSSRVLANHLTRMDLEMTVADKGREFWGEITMGVSSGLEMALLPHGSQLRQDLIERTECLQLLVGVSILTCETENERAEIINKWIEVAIDTKTALGNLFGFSGIMLGLCLPQVQRLSRTWYVLRQKFTDSAFNYEAKLRPTLISMNECKNPQAPNTTVPHILPVVLLQERTLEDSNENNYVDDSLASRVFATSDISPDCGLTIAWHHLESSRRFATSLPFFRRNAEIVLADTKQDDLILDLFRTEFHLRFLWGSRGASVAAAERRIKFHQVLNVMSDKCEPS